MKDLDLTWFDWSLIAGAAFLLWHMPDLVGMWADAGQWAAVRSVAGK